jgi:N,N'-diacetyllegionaminate synthase
MKLGTKELSTEHGPLIIAEVAQAHDGSLGSAHSYIDAIADAGAEAVKFQTHFASEESTPSEPWRIKFSRKDETRYEYWKRMEFEPEEWSELKAHADERGLIFLSSPFSTKAIDLLLGLDVVGWKVASGELANLPLIKRMAETKLPVMLSSGMSPWSELDMAVEVVRKAGAPLAVMQCTSAYPCPLEKIGINVLEEIRERYQCPTGLSDHSGTIYPGLHAASLGASLVEVHVTFHQKMFGPDVTSSVTFEELAQLVEGCRAMHTMRSNPIGKDAEAGRLHPMRQLFTRSLVTRSALSKGTLLANGHFVLKKPGTGLPESEREHLIGKRLKQDLPADHLITMEDIEAG